MAQLESLYLGANKISDISLLKDMTNFYHVGLERNPINSSQIDMLEEALPNCKIKYEDNWT